MRDTAINRVSEPSKSLVAESDDSVESLLRWKAEEQLGGVAGPKHLVYSRKVSGALIGIEVGCENTHRLHALSPKELASPTRPASSTAMAELITHHYATVVLHLSLYVVRLLCVMISLLSVFVRRLLGTSSEGESILNKTRCVLTEEKLASYVANI